MEKPKFKLSPSTISLMIDCPRCFWLHMVEKVKRPSGAFPSLPGGMDKVLKTHFDFFMERVTLPPELKEVKGMEKYRLFDDKKKLKVWQNNFKGLQYYDKKSNVLFRGAIDNMLVKGKKLVVLDYKTRGYPLKEDTHEHYLHQMCLYNFLLEKQGYKHEDYAFLLFYYPNKVLETGEVIFDTKLIKMNAPAQEGEELFKRAVKLLNLNKPPKSDKNCEWCKYGAN